MADVEVLAHELERHRPRLWAMAYRMLGSVAEADDALQEAWLRIRRTPAEGVWNPGGWLTTAVAHVCLDLLRARRARPEDPGGVRLPDPIITAEDVRSPETEALLADSVGMALQVVLGTLNPAERVALVLHDSFAVPFEDVAVILDRTPEAARQLASRARRRVRAAPAPDTGIAAQRRVVGAFFDAARRGDLDGLVEVLDPDVLLRGDLGDGTLREITGSGEAAAEAVRFAHPQAELRPVLVNGAAGVVVSVHGQPSVIMAFTVTGGWVAEIDVLADTARVRAAIAARITL
jgi:RNA polymerase sigma factor (sigma-70 family)